VHKTLRRMARVVDRQNAGDHAYRPMAPRGVQGCLRLIFKVRLGLWILRHRRRKAKVFARSSSDVGETHVIERTLYAGGAP